MKFSFFFVFNAFLRLDYACAQRALDNAAERD